MEEIKSSPLGDISDNKNGAHDQPAWHQAMINYNNYCQFVGSEARFHPEQPHRLLELVLSKQFDVKKHLRLRDEHGRSLVHYLALVHSVHFATILLGNGVAPAFPGHAHLFHVDADGLSALHYAAFAHGDVRKVLSGLSQRVSYQRLDVEAVNRFGHSAADLAVHTGNQPFAATCNNLDTDVHAFVYQLPHIIKNYRNLVAADTRVLDQFRATERFHPLLLNFRYVEDRDNTLLHIACEHGVLPIIELLLREGANVNAMNAEGDTPLHLAMRCPRQAIRVDQDATEYQTFLGAKGLLVVDVLLRGGADPNVVNRANRSALECAHKGENDRRVKLVQCKLERQRQKFDPHYQYHHIATKDILDKTYWSKTLALQTREGVMGEAAENHKEVNLRLNYARLAMRKAGEELAVVYPTTSWNIPTLFKAAKSHHATLVDEIKALIKQLATDKLPDDASEADQALHQAFAENPYQTFINQCLKGERGLFKQARMTVLQKDSNPNGCLMQFLDHLKKMMIACRDNDLLLLDVPGYNKK